MRRYGVIKFVDRDNKTAKTTLSVLACDNTVLIDAAAWLGSMSRSAVSFVSSSVIEDDIPYQSQPTADSDVDWRWVVTAQDRNGHIHKWQIPDLQHNSAWIRKDRKGWHMSDRLLLSLPILLSTQEVVYGLIGLMEVVTGYELAPLRSPIYKRR